MKAPQPGDEWTRLQALSRYEILDTLPEPAFDRVTALAADLFDAPAAAVNFVDEARVWSKSSVGGGPVETPRDDSLCAWAILDPDVTIVPDARADERFRDLPAVRGAPGVRFYAAAPLVTPDGHPVGTLCVADTRPRDLDARDAARLAALAALVVDELEARHKAAEQERRGEALAALNASLRSTLAFSESLLAVYDLLDLDLPVHDVLLHGAALLSRNVSADATSLIAVRGDEGRAHTVWATPRGRRFVAATGDTLHRRDGGVVFEVASHGGARFVDDYPATAGAHPAMVAAGARACAWAFVGVQDGTRFVLTCARVHGERGWSAHDRALVNTAARTLGAFVSRSARLEALAQDARRDALTGLGNRRALEDALRARPRGFGVAVLDLDGLKKVNDEHGHARGDALLRLFASALAAELPAADVFRPGGDEFVLLAPGAPPAEEWRGHVRRAMDAAIGAVRAAGFADIGASFGAALAAEADTPPAALDLADARMYADKRRRRAAESAEDLPPAPHDEEPQHLLVQADARTAAYGDRSVRLSPKESALLVVLAGEPGRVFSREDLARLAWGADAPASSNVVDVHLTGVRKKLAALAPHLGVRAVRGTGYALSAPNASVEASVEAG